MHPARQTIDGQGAGFQLFARDLLAPFVVAEILDINANRLAVQQYIGQFGARLAAGGLKIEPLAERRFEHRGERRLRVRSHLHVAGKAGRQPVEDQTLAPRRFSFSVAVRAGALTRSRCSTSRIEERHQTARRAGRGSCRAFTFPNRGGKRSFAGTVDQQLVFAAQQLNLRAGERQAAAAHFGRLAADLRGRRRRCALSQLEQVAAQANGILPRLGRAGFVDRGLPVDIQVFQLERPAANDGLQLNLRPADVKLLQRRLANDVANRGLRRRIAGERGRLHRFANHPRRSKRLDRLWLRGQIDKPRLQPARINIELRRDDAHVADGQKPIGNDGGFEL